MKARLGLCAVAGMTTLAATTFHSPAVAQDCQSEGLTQAGTYEATAKGVGFILGARWGEGTLTLTDGSQHSFTFNGGKLLDTGVAQTTIKGNVYNLNKLEDFAGDYGVFGGSLTLVKGVAGDSVISNESCVFVDVTDFESEGVRLSAPAPGSVVIKLEEF